MINNCYATYIKSVSNMAWKNEGSTVGMQLVLMNGVWGCGAHLLGIVIIFFFVNDFSFSFHLREEYYIAY